MKEPLSIPAHTHISAVVSRCISDAIEQYVLPNGPPELRQEFLSGLAAAPYAASLAEIIGSAGDDALNIAAAHVFERCEGSIEYGSILSLVYEVRERARTAAVFTLHRNSLYAG